MLSLPDCVLGSAHLQQLICFDCQRVKVGSSHKLSLHTLYVITVSHSSCCCLLAVDQIHTKQSWQLSLRSPASL